MSEDIDALASQTHDVSSGRERRAELCIRNHVIAAMGCALIPSFIIDVAVVTGIEVKMIRDLAAIYDFPVPRKLVAYKLLLSLIGSIAPLYFAAKAKSAVKGVPLFGHATYIGFLSLTNAAAVYAVGKIFQKHYETGGNFLGSKKNTLKNYFETQYTQGKQLAPGLRAESRLG